MKRSKSKQNVKTKAKVAKPTAEVQTTEEANAPIENQEDLKNLTDSEKEELTGLEATIRGSQTQFVALGSALHTILEKRLYKEFADFDTYCDEKWGFSGSHARRLIDAYAVIRVLGAGSSPIGEGLLPRNEFQARILHDSDEESNWVENWNKVLKAAKKDAAAITGTLVKEILGPKTGSASPKKSSATDVVDKVLKLIADRKENLNSLEAAKELLTKIEKTLSKLTA